MSLKIWLPLNGSIDNQGVNNISVTNTNATVSDSGKTGKCYYFNGSTARISCSTISCTYPMTIMAWCKPTDVTNSTTQYWLSYNTASGGTAGHAIGFGTYGGKFSIWYNGTNTSSDIATINNNTWYHIALSISSSKVCTLYVNGVQTYQTSFSGTQPSSTWFTLGARSNSSTGGVGGALYFYKGYMNDARFYDSELTAEQIKKISMGLMVHCPFNASGCGQENLLANTDFNGVSKKFTLASGTEGGFQFPPISIQRGQKYTVSCRLRGNANMTLYRICSGGNEATPWVDRANLSTTEYKKFSIVFTSPSAKDVSQIYICTRYGTANSSIGDWFEIEPCSLKLEEGEIATPWCPASSDNKYSLIGLGNGVEYDISGNNHNGTITGTLSVTSDTPRYRVSTKFSGSQYITFSSLTAEAKSASFWLKATPTTSNLVVFADYASKLAFGFHSNGAFIVTCGSGASKGRVTYASSQWNVDQWHHIVVVKNDGNSYTTYLDGEVLTNTSTNNWTHSDNNFTIGKRSTGSNYVGLLSDFRIYATALSADDVLSLYNGN